MTKRQRNVVHNMKSEVSLLIATGSSFEMPSNTVLFPKPATVNSRSKSILSGAVHFTPIYQLLHDQQRNPKQFSVHYFSSKFRNDTFEDDMSSIFSDRQDNNRNTNMNIDQSDTVENLVRFNNLGVDHLRLGHFEQASCFLARALSVSQVLLSSATFAEQQEQGGPSTLYKTTMTTAAVDRGASYGYASLCAPFVSLRAIRIPEVDREGGGVAGTLSSSLPPPPAAPLVGAATTTDTSTIFRVAFHLCLKEEQLLAATTRRADSEDSGGCSYTASPCSTIALFQTLNRCGMICVFNLAICHHLHAVELLLQQRLQHVGGDSNDDALAGSSPAAKHAAIKASKLYDYTYVLATECSDCPCVLGTEQVALLGMMALAALNNRVHVHGYLLYAGDQALQAAREQLFVSVFVLLQQSIGSGLFLSSSHSLWGETTTRRMKRCSRQQQQQDSTLDNEDEKEEEDEFSFMLRPILNTLSRILLLNPCLSPAA